MSNLVFAPTKNKKKKKKKKKAYMLIQMKYMKVWHLWKICDFWLFSAKNYKICN